MERAQACSRGGPEAAKAFGVILFLLVLFRLRATEIVIAYPRSFPGFLSAPGPFAEKLHHMQRFWHIANHNIWYRVFTLFRRCIFSTDAKTKCRMPRGGGMRHFCVWHATAALPFALDLEPPAGPTGIFARNAGKCQSGSDALKSGCKAQGLLTEQVAVGSSAG